MPRLRTRDIRAERPALVRKSLNVGFMVRNSEDPVNLEAGNLQAAVKPLLSGFPAEAGLSAVCRPFRWFLPGVLALADLIAILGTS